MQSDRQPLSPTLRSTPLEFRALLGAGVLIVVVGYGLLLSLSLGPPPAEIITETGFLLLAALVLLADLYPLVPSMKDVRAKVTFAWSAAISLAAVLVYGPSASLLFLLSGLTAALSRRSGPWWQTLLNTVVFGVIGLAVALLSGISDTFDPLMPPGAWRLTIWGLALAVVVVVLYSLLLALALTRLRVSTWRAQRERFGKSVRIWGISLIAAPMLAVLAVDGPWALLSMAVVIVSLNQMSTTMFRSTAASRTDGLTGLANRATLTRRLSARIARLGIDRTVTLLLIDLNRFKDVNDTYGHLVGDEVLIEVADRLRTAASPADLVARYGGDEFAVVLGPGVDADRARTAADAFRYSLSQPVRVGEIEVVVGGSVGIAEATDPGADVLGLVEAADRDMYRTKRGQRVTDVDAAPTDGLRRDGRRRDGGVGRGRPVVIRQPVWSVTVQGSATPPAGGWPGVRLSTTPGSDGAGALGRAGSVPIDGGLV